MQKSELAFSCKCLQYILALDKILMLCRLTQYVYIKIDEDKMKPNVRKKGQMRI